jgi:hypothetical protein
LEDTVADQIQATLKHEFDRGTHRPVPVTRPRSAGGAAAAEETEEAILPADVAFDFTPLSGTGVTVERLP